MCCKGFQIDFHSIPFQFCPPVTRASFSETQLINAEVQELLKKGAIPSDQAFYSSLFLVPKKEGTYRPVIDLSSSNRFVPHVRFQMDELHSLKALLRKGDYMTSIDLKKAYLSPAFRLCRSVF